MFPVLHHELRTEGFFKVRGININHGDLEDFMFAEATVSDFRAEALNDGGLDALRLADRGAPRRRPDAVRRGLGERIKATFEPDARDRGARDGHARRASSRRR